MTLKARLTAAALAVALIGGTAGVALADLDSLRRIAGMQHEGWRRHGEPLHDHAAWQGGGHYGRERIG